MTASITFEVVPAGTVVRDERTGKSITVRDNQAVRAGNFVYLTQTQFDRVKDHPA